jgi:hypothetical protein
VKPGPTLIFVLDEKREVPDAVEVLVTPSILHCLPLLVLSPNRSNFIYAFLDAETAHVHRGCKSVSDQRGVVTVVFLDAGVEEDFLPDESWVMRNVMVGQLYASCPWMAEWRKLAVLTSSFAVVSRAWSVTREIEKGIEEWGGVG